MQKSNKVLEGLEELKKMNLQYLQEINQLVKEIKRHKQFQIISYFTYSISISHKKETENICLGSYHVSNLGSVPLHNPYICIKVLDSCPFEFSGKYVYPGMNKKMKVANSWERLNEAHDQREFWLKPTDTVVLQPSESLSFPNFLLKWKPDSSYSGSVMGFAYGDELDEGLSALNQINISGNIKEEKEIE